MTLYQWTSFSMTIPGGNRVVDDPDAMTAEVQRRRGKPGKLTGFVVCRP